MTTTKRQALFERFLTALAKRRSERLGLHYVGTLRRLPPPPLPGQGPETTLYYVNASEGERSGPRLFELGAQADAALRRAEKWVETGEGAAPSVPEAKPRGRPLKRKV